MAVTWQREVAMTYLMNVALCAVWVCRVAFYILAVAIVLDGAPLFIAIVVDFWRDTTICLLRVVNDDCIDCVR